MPRSTPSSWARRLTEWISDNNFTVLNEPGEPMWRGGPNGERQSVIDLVIANDAARYLGQISDVEISFPKSLSSNHTTLIFHIYPENSISVIPPPAPKGYQADKDCRLKWCKAFRSCFPLELDPRATDQAGERMIEGLTDSPCVCMTQPVSHALLGEAGPVGDPEDILDRA